MLIRSIYMLLGRGKVIMTFLVIFLSTAPLLKKNLQRGGYVYDFS